MLHANASIAIFNAEIGINREGQKPRFTLADGTTFERDRNDGEAFINPAITHSDECLADQLAILENLKQ